MTMKSNKRKKEQATVPPGSPSGAEQAPAPGQILIFTMVMRQKEGEVPELSYTTTLEDFGVWMQVFDVLRLDFERNRIREEERQRQKHEQDETDRNQEAG